MLCVQKEKYSPPPLFFTLGSNRLGKKEMTKKKKKKKKRFHPTLLDFMENKDNFEARVEQVNFGLFQF